MRKQSKIKRAILLLAIGLMFGVNSAWAGMKGWHDDFEKAKTEAAKTGRPILVNFSGSDWCGWCIRLDKEVFSKDAFKKYAKDNLILFNADFPQNTKLPKKEAEQNQKLAQQFGIPGFPTVLLLASDGKTVIAKTGYQQGGPEKYIKHLAGLIMNHKMKKSGKQDAEATPKKPKPNEYDAENNRYWNADHGHWHPGRPPAAK